MWVPKQFGEMKKKKKTVHKKKSIQTSDYEDFSLHIHIDTKHLCLRQSTPGNTPTKVDYKDR